LTTLNKLREERMSRYKVVLTETDTGRNDHANHLRRRAKGIVSATDLSLTGPDGAPIDNYITEIPGYYYTYEWIMDDPTDNHIHIFVWWCNAQGFVTCPGPIRVFTGKEASTLVDSYNRFSEKRKASGNF
jgi:hypothetical protein